LISETVAKPDNPPKIKHIKTQIRILKINFIIQKV